MTPDQRVLWEQLAGLAIDGGPHTRGFAARLARENGWSARYAEGAIEEYRRFLFIAGVAGHPVSPSDPIDQVWHLHLLYTRSYWDELCTGILRKPLHHLPSQGDDGATFQQWYADTLASYERLFDAPPPPAWWPPTGTPHPEHRWIDTRKAWVVPKPWG